ncbi:MAG: hypothetical protein O2854_01740 [Chloroflexi bacterium]|nr:hypothetical protein [Chloroflexota bacterium]
MSKWNPTAVLGLALGGALLAGIACAPAASEPGSQTPVVTRTPIVNTPTPTEEPQEVSNLDALLEMAKLDIMTRFDVEPESVQLDSAIDMEWPDASLGNPKLGQSYAQVITPGYKLVLEVGDDTYVYHTSMDRVDFVSKNGGPAVALTDEDKAAIVRAALEWAIVDQNVPDYGLLNPDSIVLSLEGIGVIEIPELEGLNFVILSAEEVQARANESGDFPYVRVSEVRQNGTVVEISIETQMAAAEDSEIGYLVGGGCFLRFEQVDGEWAITEQPGACWIS